MHELEKSATAAEDIQEFIGFSLKGTRELVNELTATIGKIEGIFSRYTLHNEKHIDSMLHIADWLIPSETKAIMTPSDYLLLVLSIYFHDFGMVVTQGEFDNRTQNEEYKKYLSDLRTSQDSFDFRAKVEELEPHKRDAFLYEEFIRRTHAQRVERWIRGKSQLATPNDISLIEKEIHKTLNPLNSGFIDDLAKSCASHHLDDLDDNEKYPLHSLYGNSKGATANVQYCATILRTADLLHITKDRTPSRSFQVMKISDPTSVMEWKKQMGVFAVGPVSKVLKLSDPDTHYIRVNADLESENSFFSLTEYLSYANDQIRQSRRWIEKSKSDAAGEGFHFPWLGIKQAIKVQGVAPEPIRFELDRGRLLDLLVGHTIYNEPTVVIRELVQNAIDATRFEQHRNDRLNDNSDDSPAIVEIDFDSKKRELSITDNGTGMDLDTIKNHLLNVGSSYYDTPQFQSKNPDFTAISRFGIGVLTCFMVSDDIEIVTKKSNVAHSIKMSSVHSNYLLRKLDKNDERLRKIKENGTVVRLRFRPSVDIDSSLILKILDYWIIVPACKIVYSHDNTDRYGIGKQSITEAVDAIKTSVQAQNPFAFLESRVKKISRVIGNEKIELAFLVHEQWSTWNGITKPSSPDQSTVCIEGIHVDNVIPGFKPDQIVGILSLRGNRAFRTNVSRSEIEHDDEYGRISEICAGMLIEFLQEEVDKIANSRGTPLSQASFAARSLIHSLFELTDNADIVEKMQESFRSVPSIVLERATPVNEEGATRELVSYNEFVKLKKFHTIQSRIVDSLNTISRDLRREIGIFEFIKALVPERLDKDRELIVIEAAKIRPSIRATHYPVSAKFNKAFKETLVEWQEGASVFSTLEVWRMSSKEQANFLGTFGMPAIEILEIKDKDEINNALALLSQFFGSSGNWEICPINGEDSKADMVSSEICKFLDSSCKIGKFFNNLLLAYKDRLSSEKTLAKEEQLLIESTIGSIEPVRAALQNQQSRRNDTHTVKYMMPKLAAWAADFLNVERPNFDILLEIEGLEAFDVSRYYYDWSSR